MTSGGVGGVQERITEVLRDHTPVTMDGFGIDDEAVPRACLCGEWSVISSNFRSWDEHVTYLIQQVLDPTITTQDELDALPHLALLLRPYQSQAGWSLHEVWEKRHDVWHCLAAPLSPPAHHDGAPLLPAILLWSPS